MILDQSDWAPNDEARVIPRDIIRTAALARLTGCFKFRKGWPSFRGPQASGIAEGQNLPEKWNGKTGENILWRTQFQDSRIQVRWFGKSNFRHQRRQQ
jgi:hypothetical protein